MILHLMTLDVWMAKTLIVNRVAKQKRFHYCSDISLVRSSDCSLHCCTDWSDVRPTCGRNSRYGWWGSAETLDPSNIWADIRGTASDWTQWSPTAPPKSPNRNNECWESDNCLTACKRCPNCDEALLLVRAAPDSGLRSERPSNQFSILLFLIEFMQ